MALGSGLSPDEIILKIKAEKEDAEKSVKSIKQELREAQQEALALGRKFGENSIQAVNAAQKVAKLRDEVEDFNAKVKALNPDKLSAFSTGINGVVRGFQAAQGAAVLFGGESKELQKNIERLQGVMNFADGIQGVLEMNAAFGGLANKIKIQVVSAFSSLKGAMIASGIGVLVVTLGVLISEMMDYNEELERQAHAEENARKEREKRIDQMEKQVKKTKDLRAAQKGGLDELRRELALLEAKGATDQAIHDKKLQILQKERSELRIAMESGLDVAKEFKDKENEIEVEKAAFKKKIDDKQSESDKKNALKRKELNEKTTAAYYANEERRISLIEDVNKRELQAFDLSRNELRLKSKKAGEDLVLFDKESAKLRADIESKQNKESLDKRIKAQEKFIADKKALAEADGIMTLSELDAIQVDEKKLLDEKLKEKLISETEYNAAVIALATARNENIKSAEEKSLADKKKQLTDELTATEFYFDQLTRLRGAKGLSQDEIQKRANQEKDTYKKMREANIITEIEYQKALQKIRDEADKAEEDRLAKRQQNLKFVSDTALETTALLSSINDIEAQNNKNRYDAQKAIFDNQLRDRVISKAEYDKRILALDAKNEDQAKKSFEDNKRLQIAETIIQTLAGAQNAYTSALKNPISVMSGTAYASIMAGLAIAAGSARVAKIKQTQYKSSGSSAGGASVGGGGGSQAAATGFSTVNAPMNISTPQKQQEPKPLKVFVVQKDIAESTKSADSILAKAVVK